MKGAWFTRPSRHCGVESSAELATTIVPGGILLFGRGGYDARIAVTGENDVQ
jgi:hypothetical protein